MTMKSNFRTSIQKKTFNRIVLYGVILILWIPLSVRGQSGSTSVPFLTISPDAQSVSLGNTGVARTESSHLAYWNPALIAHQQDATIAFSHSNWLPGLGVNFTHDYLSVSNALSASDAVSISVNWFNLGAQRATDDQGNDLGSFGNYDLSVHAAYGRMITENWSAGVGLSYILSNIGSEQKSDGYKINTARSLALDLGILWKSDSFNVSKHESILTSGLSLQHLGPHISYLDGQYNSLPATFRFGWSLDNRLFGGNIHRVIFSTEFAKSISRNEFKGDGSETTLSPMNPFKAIFLSWQAVDVVSTPETTSLSVLEQLTFGFGTEYWYDSTVALRAGYYYENPYNGGREILTFGAGLRYRRYGADFSYIHALNGDAHLSQTIRITVSIGLESMYRNP